MKPAPHNDKDAHWYLIDGMGVSATNQENDG